MEIAKERLARNFLVDSPFGTAPDLTAALGAVQAQDYDGAKWAISQRTGLTDAAIEREFTRGSFLRTHVLRPTWHFVHPADIRWMLALTGPRVMKTMASYDRKLELDDKVYRRTNSAIEKALRDGNHMTRAELKVVLARAKVGTLGAQRAAHIVMRAELEAIICSGPRRGRQFTYALLDERAPGVPGRDRDDALRDLTLRYFRTRSPATAQDYAWWSGLAMSDVRRGIELAAELVQVRIDGNSYWRYGEAPSPLPPAAHLLPNYDEFFIGYRDRSAIGRRLRSVSSVTGGNALIAHVIALDGQLVGGWRRAQVRGGLELHLTLLAPITGAERKRLSQVHDRYQSFVGCPVALRGLDKQLKRVRTRSAGSTAR